MKIRYNAPTTLTFTLAAAVVLLLSGTVVPGLTESWFSTPAPFHANQLKDYVKLFSHALGHASVDHYISNFSFILLLGPILESTYGSLMMLIMMFVTALVTGILNVLLFPGTILLGASGVVFMMILLASFTNFRKGEVPLTFILIMVIYLGREVWNAVGHHDNISQFAHIVGGLTGSFFGFFKPARRD
ncbi:MAG TPA: rhomboid family intramembrane serine protease [Rectinemataceae bacterium]|nr:rhomboid family intramembrane serine protease [Rectinemataceae bacterium]